jgi:hypothetical protein
MRPGGRCKMLRDRSMRVLWGFFLFLILVPAIPVLLPQRLAVVVIVCGPFLLAALGCLLLAVGQRDRRPLPPVVRVVLLLAGLSCGYVGLTLLSVFAT